MSISRRQWLAGALGLGTLGFAPKAKAQAQVACGPTFTPFGQRLVCTAGLQSSMIQVAATRNHQHQTEWCWAASIAMVFQYHRHPVSQERIVAETYGNIGNWPGSPALIIRALNRRWKDDSGSSFRSSSNLGATDSASAARDLAADEPLIIGVNNGMSAHAMVLTALTYSAPAMMGPYGPTTGAVSVDAATVRDPWPGMGRRNLSGREWLSIFFAVRIRVTDEPDDDDDP